MNGQRYNIYIIRVCTHTYTYIHTYTVEYYSTIKKNEIVSFETTWMNLEIIILSEVRQRKIDIIWYHLYVESKTNELTYKTEKLISIKMVKKKLMVTKGKGGEGGNKLGVWINRYTSNKDLLYSTRTYIQYLIITYNGKESEAVYLKLTRYYKSTIV